VQLLTTAKDLMNKVYDGRGKKTENSPHIRGKGEKKVERLGGRTKEKVMVLIGVENRFFGGTKKNARERYAKDEV